MKTFNDLEFKERVGGVSGDRATMFFNNGYGVSVITGAMFYTSPDKPYEMAVLYGDAKSSDITYNTHITDDVLGYLTADDVTKHMAEVQALSE